MLPLTDFNTYIFTNALFTSDQKILLAVSGGKDSVLMAHLFKLAGYSFGIAHCNFNLRADESQRDEGFVKLLAGMMDVPFHSVHFDTKGYAAEHGISTQMAARDLRYEWFEQIRRQESYDCIAVAHHQSDSVETVLLNLTRGTGISGLHGILPKRGFIIRPLLFLSREEIDEIIQENPIDFVEDSSNEKVTYARNKIRHHVVPQLKQINAKLEQTFEQNIQRFAETELVLHKVVEALRKDLVVDKAGALYISIEEVRQLRPQRLLLHEILRPYLFTECVVEDIMRSFDHQSGTSFYSATHRLTINRGDLVITPIVLKEQQHLMIHPADQLVDLGRQLFYISYENSNVYSRDLNIAYIDLEKLIFPLIVRYRQEGDRFMPLGMTTFKKLSDFFIDKKVPLPQKDSIPILVNGNGELIWVAGLRQDNRYKVTATTKKVVIFELKFK